MSLLRYLARQGEHEVLMISVDSLRKATYIPASGFTCGLLLGPQRISADGKDQEGTLIILGFNNLEVQAVQKVRKPRRCQLCGLAVVVKCHHPCSETRCEEPQCSETAPGSGTAQTRSNPQKKVIRLCGGGYQFVSERPGMCCTKQCCCLCCLEGWSLLLQALLQETRGKFRESALPVYR